MRADGTGGRETTTRAAQTAAEAIIERLRGEGYDAYLAGGCVRDLLLGREPLDFDVATSARPETVLNMFPRTFAVGAHFGVVLVADEQQGREMVTEVATFRSDGAYSDGRHPEAVRFSDKPEEDVVRRDFTINGMLLDTRILAETCDPVRATLDYVGGRTDLDAGLIRAIGDASTRFGEDKLRMLRAVRFAARFDFKLENATAAAIRHLATELKQVSHERVRDELTRMLTEGRARRAFELLDGTGLLREVLPEIDRMHGVEQPPEYHPEGDVFVHTMLLLDQLPPGAPLTLAWGALLHDVGKPATFRRAPDRIRFDGHVELGVRIAHDVCNRLRFSNEDTAQIVSLVNNHMRFGDVKNMKGSTLKRFFRLPDFEQHLALHRMDCSAAHGDLSLYDFAKERYHSLPVEEIKPVPLVTGRELIAAGYRPGPLFKQMLAVAEDAQLEGRVVDREEALALLRTQFKPD
jgi:poly(A) polymerase